jgi:uncharacterized membrane protein
MTLPSRSFLFRQIRARSRLWVCGLVGMLTTLLLVEVPALQTITRLVIGWNAFASLYLLCVAHRVLRADHNEMQIRTQEQDEGQLIVLAMVVLAALATLGALGAIIAELAVVKDLHGTARYAHIGLAALTIATSWLFTHVMFARHYAHDFYFNRTLGMAEGLAFPGTKHHNHGDFVYFACIIGTSGQTADVDFTTSAMRRTGLLHCVLAFFFNTTLVALTINIASGLF